MFERSPDKITTYDFNWDQLIANSAEYRVTGSRVGVDREGGGVVQRRAVLGAVFCVTGVGAQGSVLTTRRALRHAVPARPARAHRIR